MRLKLYNQVLIGVAAGMLVIALPFTFWLEPLRGDLTRVGGYSETNYGWHASQSSLKQPAAQKGRLGTYYDIIVLGDSFSGPEGHAQTPAGAYWTDFLAQRTGLKVGVFQIDNPFTAEQILNSDAANPPKIFIYESIERLLLVRLGNSTKSCPMPAGHSRNAPLPAQNNSPQLVALERPTDNSVFKLPLGYAYEYISQNLGLYWQKRVYDLGLTRGSFFSNRRSNEALVYYEEVEKSAWREKDWRQILCNVQQMQNFVENNGRTAFLTMLPPDKLTAYSPYLLDQKYADISKLSLMLNGLKANHVRIDQSIHDLIAGGVIDVYLPDDTHWGWRGHLQAAEDVYTNLVHNGVITQTLP